jgi:phage-related protein
MPEHTVTCDAAALKEMLVAIKAKEEKRALLNAIDKLEALGEQLAPPHMKPLGAGAGGLRELRPRQGNSDWRPIYMRIGAKAYVVLAVGRHDEFERLIARAQARAARYEGWTT